MMSTRALLTASILSVGLISAAPLLAKPPQVEDYGVLKDGHRVQQYTLTNKHGMRVRILSYGGIISEISVADRTGQITNVVFTKPNLEAYEAGSNFSSLLGRYANRISGGGFTLDGKRYDLAGAAANKMVLHGGPNNFSQQVWAGAPFGGNTGSSGVTLSLASPDGTNGFPGNLEVQVKYTLDDNDTLRLDYRAVTDKPTVVNLSHHVYFNLAGALTGIADDQCIQVLADRYGATNAQAMTGELPSVAGTPLDLRQPTRLGDRVNKGFPLLPRGFDTPYVIPAKGSSLIPAARAWDPGSGRTLELRTNQTSVQFFTPGGIPGAPRPRPAAGAEATTPPAPAHVAGYAIETEHLPESPNFPAFPSTVLRPGKVFQSATSWHFGTYDPASNICRPAILPTAAVTG